MLAFGDVRGSIGEGNNGMWCEWLERQLLELQTWNVSRTFSPRMSKEQKACLRSLTSMNATKYSNRKLINQADAIFIRSTLRQLQMCLHIIFQSHFRKRWKIENLNQAENLFFNWNGFVMEIFDLWVYFIDSQDEKLAWLNWSWSSYKPGNMNSTNVSLLLNRLQLLIIKCKYLAVKANGFH